MGHRPVCVAWLMFGLSGALVKPGKLLGVVVIDQAEIVKRIAIGLDGVRMAHATPTRESSVRWQVLSDGLFRH
jgi:hypothetical protein